MAYNQYTPATTAYVEAAFKKYNIYIEDIVAELEARVSEMETHGGIWFAYDEDGYISIYEKEQ